MSLRAIDLFAGIGGIRRGLSLAFGEGVEFVFSSEWDKFAQESYEANYQEKPHGDISSIDATEVPEHDIVLAGFPCVAFSHAGLKLGFEDERGNLFFDVARIVSYHYPEVVLLENVKGLKSHDKGRTYKVILDTMNGLGYKVFDKVLNARDFGVPQNRERIFVVCFKDHSVDFKFPCPTVDRDSLRLGDILDDNVDKRYTISDKLWEGHQRRKEKNKKEGKGFGYKLFNANSSYTSTISARYYKDGSEVLIDQSPLNPRKLTPREAARLQGFPEEHLIVVSDTQAYKQFGNSVSVPVIEAICLQIKEALNKKQEDYTPVYPPIG